MEGLNMMCIVLAVIQGLTEFLPVSSSGHLALFERIPWVQRQLAALGKEGIFFLNVALHFGTLCAVLAIMRRDIINLIKGVIQSVAARNWRSPEILITVSVVLATIPAAFVGIAFNDAVETAFTSACTVGILLLINGAILIATKLIRRFDRNIDKVGVRGALVIGLFQAAAVLPGISRSGMTITAGLIRGLEPMAAARFSFLMAIPIILGATVVEGIRGWGTSFPREYGIVLVTAMTVSFITGVIALKVLISVVKNIKLHIFGIYTVVVGTIVIIASCVIG